jgi:hypothetical protein
LFPVEVVASKGSECKKDNEVEEKIGDAEELGFSVSATIASEIFHSLLSHLSQNT